MFADVFCLSLLNKHRRNTEVFVFIKHSRDQGTLGLGLINAANVAGGQDNTTVVLAHFTDGTTAQLKRKVEIVSSKKQESAESLSAGEISLCWPTIEADVPDSQRLPLPHYSASSQVP